MLASYGDICLFSLEDTESRDWDIPAEATNVRVALPANPVTVTRMAELGYMLGDRTILCSISTRRASKEAGSRSRAEVSLEKADHDAMLDLAKSSFWGDRRFYVTPDCDQVVAERVLKDWISGLDETLVCRVKGEYAGFLALTEEPDSSACVNLAATDERFRLAGAAMALYTAAVLKAHQDGRARLVGRISSRNMPVMNLYAHLGAKFSDPLDIFLKEVR